MATRQILTSTSIDGSQGVFAGGYIYSANLEIGYTDGPSKVSISCMLPDNSGSFSAPSPDLYGKTYSIKFGNTTFHGYLLTIEQELSSGQKMLHCTFVDKSIILDQYQIGIAGRHPGGGLNNNLIVVPSEANVGGPNNPTLCVDCQTYDIITPNETSSQNSSTCDTNDLVYTFNALVNQIRSIIPIINPFSSMAKNSYTGSVREVLNNWCSDFGLTFFLDSSGFLRFIDLSNGLSINLPNLSGANLKSFRQSNSLEGSYSSGFSTFSLTPTKNHSISNQQYHQLTLGYVGPELGPNGILGAWGMADSSARDLICFQSPRNGFFNNTWDGKRENITHLAISTIELSDIAEIIGDTTIPDLIGKGYSSWILCYYSDQLKNSYVEQERLAVEQYGHQYRVLEGSQYVDTRFIDKPEDEQDTPDITECKPNLRKNIDFSCYPDFGSNLNWYKNVGPMTTNEVVRASFNEPVVIGTNSEIVDLIIQRGGPIYSFWINPGHPLVSLVGFCGGSYSINVSPGEPDPENSWEGRPTPNSGGTINTGEEELKYLNRRSETPCALDCEEGIDPCAQYTEKCNINVYNVRQGIVSRNGQKFGNVILPSIAPFYGWVKADINATISAKGESSTGAKSISNNFNVAESRFTLIDVSNGEQQVAIGSGAGSQSKVSFEIIGFPEGINLRPEDGLSRISITFGTEGVITNVEYNTRPEVPPKQNVTLQNITPRKLLF